MDIIVLNAPPMSGKDEICAYLCDGFPNFYHEQVKELLFEVAVRSAGITRELWNSLYTREYKERPSPYLLINGERVSPRQWMIHCSEHVIKPLFGKTAFGKAAVEHLKKTYPSDTVIIYSDGGFPEEIKELSDYAYQTGGEFFLARIHREGYDWGNDSRNWLYLNGIRGHEKDFDNLEGKMFECADEVRDWARHISYGETND